MAQPDTADYVIRLEPDNVLSLEWNPGVRIEAANARDAVDAVNRIADGQRYPLLVKMAVAGHLSRAARDVFVEPCAASSIALVGRNPVDRMLADYQLAAQPAPCPTRFFTSEVEAMAWLRNSGEPSNDRQEGLDGSVGGAAP
ncbi:DUF7793 family protein [Paenarthrobacter aurescens]|uniref:DUF7793 family protein n=1 Tax=Paenarthrobacter aurescens TaxID=43663 RepID=UPI0021BE91D4|nr:STAS/SEC14 domain-containing protein [Paenarthrobacter aurescens]MCT9869838.1 STAS/SEC14 domain-containing protein [Paenarthrobacter aurescens]